MGKNECKLILHDLYFSKYDFSQERGEEDQEYSTSFQINYAVNSKDESRVKVTVDTTVTNKLSSLILNLQTVGIFGIDKDGIDETTYDRLIKANTLAIIFPFIRSQLTLLTTQPGLTPVILPPININSLIENQ